MHTSAEILNNVREVPIPHCVSTMSQALIVDITRGSEFPVVGHIKARMMIMMI